MGEYINNIFKKYNIYKPKNIILCISVLILIDCTQFPYFGGNN